MEELRRQAAWAETFGLPLELISAKEAAERFPPLDTDGVARGGLPPHRRLPRPEPADAGPRQGCPSARRRPPHRNPRDRHLGERRPRHRRRGGARRGHLDDPRRYRRRRRRHLRPRDRRHGRHPRPTRCHGAPVRHHQAERPAGEHADAARSLAARVLPRRERRPRRRRLRAQPGSVGSWRHRRRLQQQAPRGRLGALRSLVRERHTARAVARRRRDREARERPGGIHARRRVHPRRVGRRRLLGGSRLLRPRHRRRRRHGPSRGGVDRPRPTRSRRLAHGLAVVSATSTAAGPTPSSGPRRSTPPTTTSSTRARNGTPADRSGSPRSSGASKRSAPPSGRSRAGSGRTGSPATSRPATRASGPEVGPARSGRRPSVPSTSPAARASPCSIRRPLPSSEISGLRRPRGPRAPLCQPHPPAGWPRRLHPAPQRTRRHREPTSP